MISPLTNSEGSQLDSLLVRMMPNFDDKYVPIDRLEAKQQLLAWNKEQLISVLAEQTLEVEKLIEQQVLDARVDIIKSLRDLPHEIAAKVYGAHDAMSESDFMDMEELDKWIGLKMNSLLQAQKDKTHE